MTNNERTNETPPSVTPGESVPTSHPSRTAMGTFFREYWLWILFPLVLLLCAVVAMAAMKGGDGEDATFIYNLF